jgi:hypothetical protein
MEIQLSALEQIALGKLSHREKRKPRDQATLIVVRELERRGLLPTEHAETKPAAEWADARV